MKFEELFINREKTIKERIKFWFSYTKTYRIEIPFKNFIHFFKNIKKWFKIIKNDRDWDYRYITDVLKFKLENTANYIESKKRYINWENDVKYIRICCKLIDKLWGSFDSEVEQYESEYSKYHQNDYNLTPVKEGYRLDSKELSENFEEYFSKNKLMYKKTLIYLKGNNTWTNKKSKTTQAMVLSKLKHEKAKRLLFKILEEKIEKFWD